MAEAKKGPGAAAALARLRDVVAPGAAIRVNRVPEAVPFDRVNVWAPIPPITRQEACSPATSPTIGFEPSTVTEAQVVLRKPETDSPVAEIAPAEKFPEASLATIALGVLADVAVVALLATLKVPPSVRFPVFVTVPVKVRPLTVPAPATEVTVPVPAPIAVRKLVASKALTVLSPLNRGKVTALGSVRVNKLLPRVLAPKLVRASASVVAPVPPFATATVPVTFPARVAVSAFPVTFPVNDPLKLVAVRAGKLVVL